LADKGAENTERGDCDHDGGGDAIFPPRGAQHLIRKKRKRT